MNGWKNSLEAERREKHVANLGVCLYNMISGRKYEVLPKNFDSLEILYIGRCPENYRLQTKCSAPLIKSLPIKTFMNLSTKYAMVVFWFQEDRKCSKGTQIIVFVRSFFTCLIIPKMPLSLFIFQKITHVFCFYSLFAIKMAKKRYRKARLRKKNQAKSRNSMRKKYVRPRISPRSQQNI